MKTTKQNRAIWSNFGVFLAFTMLSALTFSMFSPIIETKAADTLTTTVNSNINSVISLSAPADSAYAFGVLTPTDTGYFVYKSGTVSVTTNNVKGYTLTAKAATTAMTATDASTSIGACAANTSSTGSTKDWWGYSTSSTTTFNPLPTTDKIIATQGTITKTSAYTHTFNIGLKVSSALQAATYTNTITFTATTTN